MKKNIHPKIFNIVVTCSCNNKFNLFSTIEKNFNLDICSFCHPFYTGTQRIIDTGGRVEQFNKKFNLLSKKDN